MTARNDPCPCGSGKKYKNCCLPKERAARVERLTANKSLETLENVPHSESRESEPVFDAADGSLYAPSEESGALLERSDAFWNEFEDAPYDVQWAMVTEMLATEPELCDGEMLFEISGTLFGKSLEAGESGRFLELLDQMERTVPEAYEEEMAYLLPQRIQIALMDGDDASVERYFYRFSALAGDELELYLRVINTLAYHGKEEIMYEGMRQARPYVAKSEKLDSWAYDEFAEELGGLELIHMLAQNPNLGANDPTLLKHFEEYELTIEAELFATILEYRTGREIPSWTVADFEFMADKRKDPAPNKYAYLKAAFAHYAHYEEGISQTKVKMALDELDRYLKMRNEDEQGMSGQSRGKRRKRSRKQKSVRDTVRHPLCPDARSLDRFLVELLGFFSFRYYEAFALFELIPAWLRFLCKYDLLDGDAKLMVLQDLSRLKGDLINVARLKVADPGVLGNLGNWPYE